MFKLLSSVLLLCFAALVARASPVGQLSGRTFQNVTLQDSSWKSPASTSALTAAVQSSQITSNAPWSIPIASPSMVQVTSRSSEPSISRSSQGWTSSTTNWNHASISHEPSAVAKTQQRSAQLDSIPVTSKGSASTSLVKSQGLIATDLAATIPTTTARAMPPAMSTAMMSQQASSLRVSSGSQSTESTVHPSSPTSTSDTLSTTSARHYTEFSIPITATITPAQSPAVSPGQLSAFKTNPASSSAPAAATPTSASPKPIAVIDTLLENVNNYFASNSSISTVLPHAKTNYTEASECGYVVRTMEQSLTAAMTEGSGNVASPHLHFTANKNGTVVVADSDVQLVVHSGFLLAFQVTMNSSLCESSDEAISSKRRRDDGWLMTHYQRRWYG